MFGKELERSGFDPAPVLFNPVFGNSGHREGSSFSIAQTAIICQGGHQSFLDALGFSGRLYTLAVTRNKIVIMPPRKICQSPSRPTTPRACPVIKVLAGTH